MQDRDAADIGDFFKLGLLRWLVAPSPYAHRLRLGVIWFRVADERVDCDQQVAYRDRMGAADQDLRPLDVNLYDRLGAMAAAGDRSIGALVSWGVLPADTVTYDRELTFADLPANDRVRRAVRRERWFHDAMVTVDRCSLVFVDPGNVLRHVVRAVPPSRNRADKHAYLSEIGQLLARGQSVVACHHADPSKSVPAQALAEMEDVREALGVDPLAVVRAARETTQMFVVIPAAGHRSDLEARVGAMQLSSWGDELRHTRWPTAVVTA